MIAQAFLAGGATLVGAVVLHRLWLGALPRSVCPSCGQATASVSHALSARTDRWMKRRWCAACGWKGWGRNGPVLSRRRGPVSHESGFRWGAERLQADFGFRWAERPAPPAETPAPAHPSGFRWAQTEDATATVCVQSPAHPSGFRFREAPEPAPTDGAHPSGFRWADESGERTAADEAADRPRRGATSFRWKS